MLERGRLLSIDRRSGLWLLLLLRLLLLLLLLLDHHLPGGLLHGDETLSRLLRGDAPCRHKMLQLQHLLVQVGR